MFQDLAVVPLLIIIPALASSPRALTVTLGYALVKAAVVLLALLVFGQRMMRPWFHLVARQKSSELFMLNVLLITLGLAYLTESAGLSLALGAFVAGMLIAETEYRYQVEDDIKPFRDVLMGLFFVTIGMMLNLGEMFAQFGWVLLLLLGLLLFKASVVALLVDHSGLFENAEEKVRWMIRLGLFLGFSYIGIVLAMRSRREFTRLSSITVVALLL